MSAARRAALAHHRSRLKDAGIVRIELQAPAVDAPILRELAAALRDRRDDAGTLREQLRSIVAGPQTGTAFDLFGSDLPDSYFTGVFEHERKRDATRDIDL